MNYALLLLAGSSNRFKDKTPKQFYLIKGKPLFFYPLNALEHSNEIDGIIVLTNKDKVLDVYNFINKNNFKKIKAVISGGITRNETVKLGLSKLKEFAKDDDIVLIHDAARVLLDKEIIEIALKETIRKEATTFALKSYDTLVKSYPNYQVKEYLNRDEIFRIQTPQTFKYKIIMDAYLNNKITNDDTELVFINKKRVYLLRGSEKLFKVTTKEDIKKVELYLCNTK